MVGIWDLQNLSIDSRQVGANGNPIIEKSRIFQPTVFPIDILFIKRPSNALGRPTLKLAFYVIRMDSFSSILNHGVAQYLGATRLFVYFHITNVTCKRNARSIGDKLIVTCNGSAGIG